MPGRPRVPWPRLQGGGSSGGQRPDANTQRETGKRGTATPAAPATRSSKKEEATRLSGRSFASAAWSDSFLRPAPLRVLRASPVRRLTPTGKKPAHRGGPATVATGFRRLFLCFSFFGKGCRTRCFCCRVGLLPCSRVLAGGGTTSPQKETASTRPAVRQPTTKATAASNRGDSAWSARAGVP